MTMQTKMDNLDVVFGVVAAARMMMSLLLGRRERSKSVWMFAHDQKCDRNEKKGYLETPPPSE